MSALKPGEQWKSVPGYTSYEVSNLGRARSWIAPGHPKLKLSTPTVLRCSLWDTGYLMLWTPSGSKAVHRLVCRAFNGPPNGARVARHLNGDKSNNRATNLAWGTHADNMADSKRHGTDPAGERNGAAKLTEAQVVAIKSRLTNERGNRAALAREFGVSPSMVERIANGQNWTHLSDPTLIREGVDK